MHSKNLILSKRNKNWTNYSMSAIKVLMSCLLTPVIRKWNENTPDFDDSRKNMKIHHRALFPFTHLMAECRFDDSRLCYYPKLSFSETFNRAMSRKPSNETIRVITLIDKKSCLITLFIVVDNASPWISGADLLWNCYSSIWRFN